MDNWLPSESILVDLIGLCTIGVRGSNETNPTVVAIHVIRRSKVAMECWVRRRPQRSGCYLVTIAKFVSAV